MYFWYFRYFLLWYFSLYLFHAHGFVFLCEREKKMYLLWLMAAVMSQVEGLCYKPSLPSSYLLIVVDMSLQHGENGGELKSKPKTKKVAVLSLKCPLFDRDP